jgi:hypothetical protein
VLVFATATALAMAFQQPPAPPQQPALQPSPVRRLEVQPDNRTLIAGDSVQIRVRALDAGGQPIPNATVNVGLLRGEGEQGSIRPETGWLIASSVGKFPLVIAVTVPGAEPFIDDNFEFRSVPGPATKVVVSPRPETIVVGQALRLEAAPFSQKNDPALDPIVWRSSAQNVVSVDQNGMLRGLAAGTARITAAAGQAQTTIDVRVVADNIARVTLTPASPSVRQGDVVSFAIDARTSTGQPVTGLTPTWSFAPGDGNLAPDGSFVAYRPGSYTVTAIVGGHAASTTMQVAERNVRTSVTLVGRLPRKEFATSEVWLHPNGDVAYLGTHQGGDRVYAIDIRNPAGPRVVDSIVVNARLVNDIITTRDGNYMILTREGAADRRNGVVIADTRDPLHPRQIADFTDGVTSGVHSVYLYETPQYGRYLYLTNDGTGAIDIVDLRDPANPRRAGEWKTDRPDPARYVHDLDIVDGLLYASYWNDGLVVLDIGNGRWGGRPDRPVMVSQHKYDLDALYKEVEDVSGPGFTRGTHTAWRQRGGGKYVFIADEVYRNGPIEGAKDESADRMYGTLQVIDVSDIENPKPVAWYTPEEGGVHNVWVVGDTLYMGAYNGGFRVFDIAGDLQGDLRAQGREIASFSTSDLDGYVPNAAFTWGVVVNPKDGLAYVNDFNNGLWIVRINPKPRRVS